MLNCFLNIKLISRIHGTNIVLRAFSLTFPQAREEDLPRNKVILERIVLSYEIALRLRDFSVLPPFRANRSF